MYHLLKRVSFSFVLVALFSLATWVSSKHAPDGSSADSKERLSTVSRFDMCLTKLDGLEHTLLKAAIESRIDPKLLLAVMVVESECTLQSNSSKGAIGVMQILPSTARSVGGFDVHKPKENIMAGAKYLRELKDRFNQDLTLTLAAYNAGPTAVARYNGVPPYRETRNYVKKVLNIYEGYEL